MFNASCCLKSSFVLHICIHTCHLLWTTILPSSHLTSLVLLSHFFIIIMLLLYYYSHINITTNYSFPSLLFFSQSPQKLLGFPRPTPSPFPFRKKKTVLLDISSETGLNKVQGTNPHVKTELGKQAWGRVTRPRWDKRVRDNPHSQY